MGQLQELDLVIVNRNTSEFLMHSLRAIIPAGIPAGWTVVVVDNASSDGSAARIREAFPGVRLMENTVNVGYARAANQGLKVTGAPFVFFLNPDATAGPELVKELVRFLESEPRAGAVSGAIVSPEGRSVDYVSRFPSLPRQLVRVTGIARLVRRVVGNGMKARQIHDIAEGKKAVRVDWVIGAAWLLRRQAMEEAGMFDEGFFMYGEDLDLCYRMRERGWLTYVLAGSRVLHIGSNGPLDRYGMLKQVLAEAAMLRFFRKHKGIVQAFVLRGVILLASGLGYIMGLTGLRPGRAGAAERLRVRIERDRMSGPMRYMAAVAVSEKEQAPGKSRRERSFTA